GSDSTSGPTPTSIVRNRAKRCRASTRKMRLVPAATKPDRLHFTDDDAANELIARDPLALLIGFALDQQVPVQTAFSGPAKLKQRLGSLDARKIAATDPAELEAVFREKPAIHRFPGSMAERVQALAQHVLEE